VMLREIVGMPLRRRIDALTRGTIAGSPLVTVLLSELR